MAFLKFIKKIAKGDNALHANYPKQTASIPKMHCQIIRFFVYKKSLRVVYIIIF